MESTVLMIKEFYKADRIIVFVNEEDTIQKAITLMLMNNYSQLPVINCKVEENGKVPEESITGFVSWKSILESIFLNPKKGKVKEILNKDFVKVKLDSKLLDVSELIFEHDFVFVIDDDKKLNMILTKESVGRLYFRKSFQFIAIEQIERDLRLLLEPVNVLIEEERSKSKDNTNIKDFSEMTFGQLQRIFNCQKYWNYLNLSVNKEVFISKLDEIREIRNKIMHFKTENLNERELHKLEVVSGFIHNLIKNTAK